MHRACQHGVCFEGGNKLAADGTRECACYYEVHYVSDD